MKVRWYRFWKRKLAKPKPKIDDAQEMAIKLFKAMIMNKQSQLNYSPNSSTRFVYSQKAWLTISRAAFSSDSYLLYIIDNSGSHSHSHEIILPNEYAYDLTEDFDEELERRMRVLEASRKKLIANELDNLINVIKHGE